MNVKKTIALFMFGALAVSGAACSGSDATPTRTRVAQAEATQTPWIIYLPVTVTPGPATATLEPTSTPSGPAATAVPPKRPPTNTRPPGPTAPPQPTTPPQPTAPPESPTPQPPAATAAPSCGESYQVTVLKDPANGTVRDVRNTGAQGKTLRFNWDPVVPYELSSKIGYRVNIRTGINSVAVYISHNEYLREAVAILNQQASWGLTQGDDLTATWNVDVIMTSGEFNDAGDDTQVPLGTIAVCGPSSPSWTIDLHVVE